MKRMGLAAVLLSGALAACAPGGERAARCSAERTPGDNARIIAEAARNRLTTSLGDCTWQELMIARNLLVRTGDTAAAASLDPLIKAREAQADTPASEASPDI